MNRNVVLLAALGFACLAGSLLLPVLAPVFALGAIAVGAVVYRTQEEGVVRRAGLGLVALGIVLAVAIAVTGTFLITHDGSAGFEAR